MPLPPAAGRTALGLAACLLPWGAGQASSHAPSCHRQTVVLRLHDGRAFVAPVIDGQQTAMVLDTGAAQTVLFSDAPARLGLPPAPDRGEAQTTSYGQPLSVHFVRAETLAFAGTQAHAVDLAVLPTAPGGTGSGFFADPRLQEAEFDLAHRALRLSCAPFPPPRWAHGGSITTVPLETVSRVFGAGAVRGAAMRILFDTGSPGSSMTLAAARRAGIAPDGPPDSVAAGLAPGSALRAWQVKVGGVTLGDGAPGEVAMTIVDKPHANADMILGLDFFSRHRLWIDRSRHVLIFEKGPPP